MGNQDNCSQRTVIGIDGGGTKTEFVLATEDGIVLRSVKLAQSNPNDIGIQKCCDVLSEGIDMLLEHSPSVCSIFAGIAGCATGDNAQRVENFLKEHYPGIEIGVDTDGVNVLSCNTNAADCMALICGTGSVLFAREKGIKYRVGGWGYLFDEAGSAYDIGRDAVRAVLAQLDSMGTETVLTELLATEMKTDIWSALGKLYREGKAYIASLAPIVFEAYTMGDRVAMEIVQKNAERLALLVETAMKQYQCGNQVVACGGLIEHYRDILIPYMKKELTEKVEFLIPDVPPVFGACVEGCRRVNLLPDRGFCKAFSRSYSSRNY